MRYLGSIKLKDKKLLIVKSLLESFTSIFANAFKYVVVDKIESRDMYTYTYNAHIRCYKRAKAHCAFWQSGIHWESMQG